MKCLLIVLVFLQDFLLATDAQIPTSPREKNLNKIAWNETKCDSTNIISAWQNCLHVVNFLQIVKNAKDACSALHYMSSCTTLMKEKAISCENDDHVLDKSVDLDSFEFFFAMCHTLCRLNAREMERLFSPSPECGLFIQNIFWQTFEEAALMEHFMPTGTFNVKEFVCGKLKAVAEHNDEQSNCNRRQFKKNIKLISDGVFRCHVPKIYRRKDFVFLENNDDAAFFGKFMGSSEVMATTMLAMLGNITESSFERDLDLVKNFETPKIIPTTGPRTLPPVEKNTTAIFHPKSSTSKTTQLTKETILTSTQPTGVNTSTATTQSTIKPITSKTAKPTESTTSTTTQSTIKPITSTTAKPTESTTSTTTQSTIKPITSKTAKPTESTTSTTTQSTIKPITSKTAKPSESTTSTTAQSTIKPITSKTAKPTESTTSTTTQSTIKPITSKTAKPTESTTSTTTQPTTAVISIAVQRITRSSSKISQIKATIPTTTTHSVTSKATSPTFESRTQSTLNTWSVADPNTTTSSPTTETSTVSETVTTSTTSTPSPTTTLTTTKPTTTKISTTKKPEVIPTTSKPTTTTETTITSTTTTKKPPKQVLKQKRKLTTTTSTSSTSTKSKPAPASNKKPAKPPKRRKPTTTTTSTIPTTEMPLVPTTTSDYYEYSTTDDYDDYSTTDDYDDYSKTDVEAERNGKKVFTENPTIKIKVSEGVAKCSKSDLNPLLPESLIDFRNDKLDVNLRAQLDVKFEHPRRENNLTPEVERNPSTTALPRKGDTPTVGKTETPVTEQTKLLKDRSDSLTTTRCRLVKSPPKRKEPPVRELTANSRINIPFSAWWLTIAALIFKMN